MTTSGERANQIWLGRSNSLKDLAFIGIVLLPLMLVPGANPVGGVASKLVMVTALAVVGAIFIMRSTLIIDSDGVRCPWPSSYRRSWNEIEKVTAVPLRRIGIRRTVATEIVLRTGETRRVHFSGGGDDPTAQLRDALTAAQSPR